jgi:hypothetical protein
VRSEWRSRFGAPGMAIGAAAWVLGTGCSVTEDCRSRNVTPSAEIANAPDTVVIAGKALVLRAELSRDFMPPLSQEGSCLRGVFHVVTADSSSPPAGLSASFAWVIRQGRAWQTPLGGPSSQPPWGLDFIPGDGGPGWAPGDTVDAVIRLHRLGQSFLLRARDQVIGMTS